MQAHTWTFWRRLHLVKNADMLTANMYANFVHKCMTTDMACACVSNERELEHFSYFHILHTFFAQIFSSLSTFFVRSFVCGYIVFFLFSLLAIFTLLKCTRKIFFFFLNARPPTHTAENPIVQLHMLHLTHEHTRTHTHTHWAKNAINSQINANYIS